MIKEEIFWHTSYTVYRPRTNGYWSDRVTDGAFTYKTHKYTNMQISTVLQNSLGELPFWCMTMWPFRATITVALMGDIILYVATKSCIVSYDKIRAPTFSHPNLMVIFVHSWIFDKGDSKSSVCNNPSSSAFKKAFLIFSIYSIPESILTHCLHNVLLTIGCRMDV